MDAVIISADGMQKELFYVAASRGRESVDVITSDRERLWDTVARSTARRSASELARRAQPGLQRGPLRGFAAAMVLLRRAAQFVSTVPQRDLRQVPGREKMRHEHGLSR